MPPPPQYLYSIEKKVEKFCVMMVDYTITISYIFIFYLYMYNQIAAMFSDKVTIFYFWGEFLFRTSSPCRD